MSRTCFKYLPKGSLVTWLNSLFKVTCEIPKMFSNALCRDIGGRVVGDVGDHRVSQRLVWRRCDGSFFSIFAVDQGII